MSWFFSFTVVTRGTAAAAGGGAARALAPTLSQPHSCLTRVPTNKPEPVARVGDPALCPPPRDHTAPLSDTHSRAAAALYLWATSLCDPFRYLQRGRHPQTAVIASERPTLSGVCRGDRPAE